jgi:2-keto-4-pentenoate hydratase
MLDKDNIAAASRVLQQHWRAGTKLANLDPAMRPRDRTEAYAIQAEIERTSAQKLFGWKIAATSEAGQKHINVPGPMAGRILAETVIADGSTASMAGNAMAVAEPEFAFRMGRDLPPRSSPYSVAEVLDAVASLHPAIELPDSPTSSAPAKRRSLPTMPARICLCWVSLRRRTGARLISSRSVQ